ncbi:MAG: M16 family metallopeptidase [Microthrixaceae bacterium]
MERTVLDNGLRILTDSLPERAVVSLAAWVGVGSRDEPDPLAGSSHFLEHLLFKGTADRDARSIALAVDGVGGDMNAFTANEHTAFYTSVPASDLDLALELLLDVLERPLLAASDVEAERHVILEELAAAQEDPDDTASVGLFEALFPGHPLGRETLGTPESIRAISRDDVAGFFSRWYQPANIVVAAAGNIDHDHLVSEVAARFGTRPTGERPMRENPGPGVAPMVFLERPTELSHLALGWRSPGAASEDRYALSVLNHVFGGGPSSILFQEIREARGLTYSVGSELSTHHDVGALSVHCATLASQGDQLLSLIQDLAGDLAADGIDEETLEHAKSALRGGLIMGFESVVARMTRLGAGETTLGRVTTVEEHLANIDDVSTEAVQRVASELFGSPRALCVVGPEEIG